MASTKKAGLQPGGYIALGVILLVVGASMVSEDIGAGFLPAIAGVVLILVGVIAMGVRLGNRN